MSRSGDRGSRCGARCWYRPGRALGLALSSPRRCGRDRRQELEGHRADSCACPPPRGSCNMPSARAPSPPCTQETEVIPLPWLGNCVTWFLCPSGVWISMKSPFLLGHLVIGVSCPRLPPTGRLSSTVQHYECHQQVRRLVLSSWGCMKAAGGRGRKAMGRTEPQPVEPGNQHWGWGASCWSGTRWGFCPFLQAA